MDGLIQRFYWQPVVEILILAIGIYYCFLFVRGTRGASIVTGFLVVMLTLSFVTSFFNLSVLRWLLGSVTTFFVVAVVVIFQPEIRRALERIGRVGSLGWMLSPADSRAVDHVADEVARAAAEMSADGHGALILLEG